MNVFDPRSIAHEIEKELEPERFTLKAVLAEAFSHAMDLDPGRPRAIEPFKVTGYSCPDAEKMAKELDHGI
jgi:hypothetical protein